MRASRTRLSSKPTSSGSTIGSPLSESDENKIVPPACRRGWDRFLNWSGAPLGGSWERGGGKLETRRQKLEGRKSKAGWRPEGRRYVSCTASERPASTRAERRRQDGDIKSLVQERPA